MLPRLRALAGSVEPHQPARRERIVLLALVAVPVLFNAIALLPELTVAVPSVNDDAEHLAFVRRASDAFARGENPIDTWVPELELGFPQFLYYQNLPHVAVAALHRALFGTIDVVTLFNAVRYILLVAFPLTVLWSLRRMGFSLSAACLAACASSLLSAPHLFGLEYGSYVWRGFGMYTQLWAAHFTFLTVAAVWSLLERGTGRALAIVMLCGLALSHLLYAYMGAITLATLFLVGAVGRDRTELWRRLREALLVGAAAAAITSYMWVPFALVPGYVNQSYGGPYVIQVFYDSHGAPTVLRWLVSGELFDADRLPVFTILVAIGIGSALLAGRRLGLLFLALFAVWLVLYFGRPTLGALADLLPMHRSVLMHRFIGGVQFAAIPLIGLGGAALWRSFAPELSPRRLALAALAVVALGAPAIVERAAYYGYNTQWVNQTREAIAADADARQLIDRVRVSGGGRVYAGTRINWGATMDFGLPFRGVKLFNVFAFDGVPALAPPYRGASIPSDVIWDFRDGEIADYELFDVRWVIAPRGLAVAPFLRSVQETARYVLYAAPGTGVAMYVRVAEHVSLPTQERLIATNRSWFATYPATRSFVRYEYPAATESRTGASAPGCTDGSTSYERVQPSRIELITSCETAGTLALKVTYHPNWTVTVDGVVQPTFMLSPSILGTSLSAGRHFIVAEYRSTPIKAPLLVLGGLVLASTIVARLWRPLRAQWPRRRSRGD